MLLCCNVAAGPQGCSAAQRTAGTGAARRRVWGRGPRESLPRAAKAVLPELGGNARASTPPRFLPLPSIDLPRPKQKQNSIINSVYRNVCKLMFPTGLTCMSPCPSKQWTCLVKKLEVTEVFNDQGLTKRLLVCSYKEIQCTL